MEQTVELLLIFGPSLRWRHNERDSVSNHQPHGCLLNSLLSRRSKKTLKLRVTGLRVGNSPGPVNSPHKGPVSRKMFPFDDVIMFKRMWRHYDEVNIASRQHLLFRYNTYHKICIPSCPQIFRPTIVYYLHLSKKASRLRLWKDRVQ